MTPAITLLQKAGVEFELHQYDHDPDRLEYGQEAVEKLALEPERVFKTLVTQLDDSRPVIAVVPVPSMLNLKALAKVLGAKKAKMADGDAVLRITGYVLGGVSPLGQKKKHTTVIDNTAEKYETIFISGGRRGLDIEIAPQTLADLAGAAFASLRN